MKTPLILALAAVAAVSQAQNLGFASNFNAFIFGNVNAKSGDSDGSIALQGSWKTGSNYVVSAHSSAPAPTYGAASNIGLYALGSVDSGTNSGSLQINSGRNAYSGGARTGGSVNMNGGGSFNASSSAVSSTLFSNQKAYSKAQSDNLHALSSASHVVDVTTDSNNYRATIYNAGGINIFRVNASSLNRNATLGILNGTGAETVIFDVINGGSVDWSTQYNGSQAKTLWNFNGATTLNVTGRQLQGSVLAVDAAVTQSQNIEGTLIANSLTVNSGELHSYSFTGNAPVPEPASMAVLILGGVSLLRRRSRA